MKKHFLAVATAALACLAGAAQAQSASYAIDPGHTFVTFEVLHFGTSTARGRFDKKEGTVQFDRAGKTGKVDITIDMASINTGVAAFNTHLIGEDFFNTAKFPTAKFTSDKFSFAGDKVSEVSGTLTLMGKSNPVTLKAANFNCYENPRLKREVCGGDFETTLLRSQYGMGYGLPNIPDSVRLTVQIEAVKQ
jgi:polyisoprenoid-binding protein YceI